MSKEKMIQIAERNLIKAERALANNRNRKGITTLEIENLSNNVEYAKTVYNLIIDNVKEDIL